MTSLESAGRSRPDKIDNRRRAVRLDFSPEPATATGEPPGDGERTGPNSADRVLRLAEHAVGGWAPTLRVAFLMLVTFVTVVVVVGVVLDVAGALAGALLGTAALHLLTRRVR